MSATSKHRRSYRPVDGLLLLNKPAGITSNRALQIVKRLLQAKKAGHTGSLDPAATGMLPLCFGEGTKVCTYLLDADKTYRVVARLGESTDSGDADGSIVASAPVPELGELRWREILGAFLGDSEQIPPMYSALKKDGKRLYELARQGQVVEREPRPIRIFEIKLLEARGRRLAFRVRCSKGTYVRTLVEDIARAAGTIAYTTSLHRESVGSFRAEDMLDLAEAEALAERDPEHLSNALLPVDTALSGWPEYRLDSAGTAAFMSGQPVSGAAIPPGLVRVYGDERRFLGVGECAADGRLAPRRVFLLSG